MRLMSQIFLMLTLLITLWVAMEQPSVHAAGAENDRVYPAVYKVSGLPLWTGKGAFDVNILMRLIRSTTEESDWESNGGKSGYKCYPENLCLVISTHRQNHMKIKELMSAIRKDKATK